MCRRFNYIQQLSQGDRAPFARAQTQRGAFARDMLPLSKSLAPLLISLIQRCDLVIR